VAFGVGVLALTALARAPRAQEIHPVLPLGQPLDGHVPIGIPSITAEDDGSWMAILLLSSPFGGTGVVRDGALISVVPQPLLSPDASIFYYWQVQGSLHNPAALVAVSGWGVPHGSTGALAIVRGGRGLYVTGGPIGASGLSSGTLVDRILGAIGANARDTVVSLIRTDRGEQALVRSLFARDGTERVRVADLVMGMLLPDGSALASIEPRSLRIPVNEHGAWLLAVRGTDGLQRLVTPGRVLFRSGDLSPLPGRVIDTILPGGDLNSLGDTLVELRLSGNPATAGVILRDSAVLAQQGEILPGLAPDALAEPAPESVRLTDSAAYWLALTDGPPERHAAFVREREPFLREGVTRLDGTLVARVQPHFDVSPSGRFWLGTAELEGVGTVLLQADFGAIVPVPGCRPGANPGRLRASTGLALAGQTFRLAVDAPAPLFATANLHVSTGPAIPGDPCGLVTPFGELLIDPGRRAFVVDVGVYTGSELAVDVALPPDPALVDRTFWAQGAFHSPGTLPLLTNGLRVEIGAP